MKGRVLWRTENLVSNSRFVVHGDYVVTGYGLASEPDRLFVVRRHDGAVVSRTRLPKPPRAWRSSMASACG